jgi:hypothetical protein
MMYLVAERDDDNVEIMDTIAGRMSMMRLKRVIDDCASHAAINDNNLIFQYLANKMFDMNFNIRTLVSYCFVNNHIYAINFFLSKNRTPKDFFVDVIIRMTVTCDHNIVTNVLHLVQTNIDQGLLILSQDGMESINLLATKSGLQFQLK